MTLAQIQANLAYVNTAPTFGEREDTMLWATVDAWDKYANANLGNARDEIENRIDLAVTRCMDAIY